MYFSTKILPFLLAFLLYAQGTHAEQVNRTHVDSLLLIWSQNDAAPNDRIEAMSKLLDDRSYLDSHFSTVE